DCSHIRIFEDLCGNCPIQQSPWAHAMNILRVFDNAYVFGLTQRLMSFTPRVYEQLPRRHCAGSNERSVLDIGCGLGVRRKYFDGFEYRGIGISWFKRWIFVNERGRFRRTETRLCELAAHLSPVTTSERVAGRSHDVVYWRFDKSWLQLSRYCDSDL